MATQPAAAHGYIIRAIPEDRSSLERAPARVQYWFSEELEPAFSSVTVRDQAGNVIAEGSVTENDRTLLSARMPTDLPDGAYVSELRIAFASDGHVVVETRVFFVGEAVGGYAGDAGVDSAVPMEIVWRALLLASTMVLFGAFTLYTLVLIPAWGNPSHSAGLLPPRVMTLLNRIVWAALALALIANVLALLQQTAVFFGAGMDRVLGEGLWNVVRIGTRFGDTWNARTLLLLLVAAVHGAGIYFRRDQPEAVRASWAANAWAAALVLGTWSVASHAPGSQVLPWIALISDWLHGLAVGMWAGAAVALALILPVALQPYEGEAKRLALLAALRGFSRIAVVGVILVVTTGIYNALNWFTVPEDVGTSYGTALIVKVGLVAILLGIGGIHQIAAHPERYRRWAERVSGMDERLRALRIDGGIGSLRIELVMVLIVLGAAAWLSATPPPKPKVDSPPAPTFEAQIGDRIVALTLSPGGTGVNTYDVQVTRDGAAETDAVVAIRLANPSRDIRGDWHTGESIGDGLYTTAGAEIDRTGTWWALLDVDGEQLAFAVDVTADAELLRTRPPTILNLMALAGVIGASIFALLPLLRKQVQRFDLSPVAVTIAIIATASGIGVAIIGLIASGESLESYNRLAAPPPSVVNISLPDGASLARGEAAFTEFCATWVGTRDLDELVERLNRLRDEDLYTSLTTDGWRGLPACMAESEPSVQWDVVNYVRTLEIKT